MLISLHAVSHERVHFLFYQQKMFVVVLSLIADVDDHYINMLRFSTFSWSFLLRRCAATESSCALFPEMLFTSATRTGMEGQGHNEGQREDETVVLISTKERDCVKDE